MTRVVTIPKEGLGIYFWSAPWVNTGDPSSRLLVRPFTV